MSLSICDDLSCPLSLSIHDTEVPRAQHSTAQHSAVIPAQSSKPSTCRSEYVSKEVCTYMHAASRLFSWSTELLAFASRLFAPKILDHLLHLSFRSILPGERASRPEPPTTRSALHATKYTRLYAPGSSHGTIMVMMPLVLLCPV